MIIGDNLLIVCYVVCEFWFIRCEIVVLLFFENINNYGNVICYLFLLLL